MLDLFYILILFKQFYFKNFIFIKKNEKVTPINMSKQLNIKMFTGKNNYWRNRKLTCLITMLILLITPQFKSVKVLCIINMTGPTFEHYQKFMLNKFSFGYLGFVCIRLF